MCAKCNPAPKKSQDTVFCAGCGLETKKIDIALVCVNCRNDSPDHSTTLVAICMIGLVMLVIGYAVGRAMAHYP